MDSTRGRVSDLSLERYVLGELSAEERAAVDRARAGDPSIDERLKEIEASDREILASYRPEFMALAIEAKAALAEAQAPGAENAGRFRRPLLLGFPAGIAAVLLIAFFAIPRLGGPSAEAAWSGRDSTRAKGGAAPQLLVYRNSTGGPESLKAGSVAASHDVLQLAYEAGTGGYGAILSIDGRGSVTYHLPEAYGGGSRRAPALAAQGRAYLARAFELDDAPGFERFFLVYSPKAFDLSALDEAARALAAEPGKARTADLGLPRALRQISFLIQKRGEQ